MKITKATLVIVSIIVVTACSTYRKNSSSKTVTQITPITVSTATVVLSPGPSPFVRPADGVYPPGNEELVAIQVQFKDVTLAKLQEGHTLYTQSACIQCHTPMNIYSHSEAQWKDIIGDMAQRAKITDAQREAVYKYVLAIKATQLK